MSKITEEDIKAVTERRYQVALSRREVLLLHWLLRQIRELPRDVSDEFVQLWDYQQAIDLREHLAEAIYKRKSPPP